MSLHVAPRSVPEGSGAWQTTPVLEADLEAFTRMQYKAFVGTGNPLHDTLFPPASDPTPADFAKGASRHRAALAAEPNNVVFIQVVDEKQAKWLEEPSGASTIKMQVGQKG